MRKKLTLSISTDNKPYGVDVNNVAILFPDDFRKTVATSIETGSFNNGDTFEVDVDKTGEPIRRSFDQTVAIHRPVEKRFSREDVLEIVAKVIRATEKGENLNLNELVPIN